MATKAGSKDGKGKAAKVVTKSATKVAGKAHAAKSPAAKAPAASAPARSNVRKTPLKSTAATTRGDDRQMQLLEIACRRFAQHGYNGTSLRDISDEAKITKAALYYHFPNKEALFDKIVTESMAHLVSTVRDACENVRDPEEKILTFLVTSAEYFHRNREAWIAGSNAVRTHDASPSMLRVLALRDEFEKLLRGYIREGIEAGKFRDVDPAMAGRVLLASVNGIYRWHNPRGKFTPMAVAQQFVDIVMGGLRKR